MRPHPTRRARPAAPAGRTGRRRRSAARPRGRPATRGGRVRTPEGPPTIGTTRRDRRSGAWSRRQATARRSTSGALSGWSRPANSTTCASSGSPSCSRAAWVSRGRKTERSTPGYDDLDPARVGAVQVDQLLRLEVGARDQHVGGLDHLLLADDPRGGLGGVAERHGVVLHLRHRVHGVHERDAPAVAGERADLAGQPVVGVDHVVVAERETGLGPQHLAGEHAQLTRQLSLAQALEGAGMDVPDSDAVPEIDDRVEPGRGRAGEDVDLDAGSGQPPGQLDHVDVHPAGVARPRLVER